MRIGLKDIEENIQPLGKRLSYDKEFIFELLAAYGRSPANITRLRNGQLNVADDKANEVAQKNIVYFKPVEDGQELYLVVDDLKSSPAVVRYSTRFVIVTDYTHLLAVDTKTNETLDIALRDISKHYAFFLPWAGMEKAQFFAENHADVKAAEKMAKLFDILIAHNEYKTALDWHNLTTFFTRLLFCFFAEDTGIFQKNQFSNAVASYTQEDGSDLKVFLKVLFASLDDEDKDGYPAHLATFPYVNGELFKDFSQIPNFNKESRKLLLEASSRLDWSEINPDIFGSMFQAVVRPGERTGLGQHYTSVPNIMKTIEPLFLDDLREEMNEAYDDHKKLEKLLGRLSRIKIFDPACGSGNFLIIAYKELRRLEHAVLERQGELSGRTQQALLGSRISIENFYGIEIDDFAHEVAILSLWLAKHQMNLEFSEKFGIDLPLIPLKETGNIVHGNAASLEWNDVLRASSDDEIYLISNPPYAGSSKQEAPQKRELSKVFSSFKNYKNLDYIAIWFYKGARFIKDKNAKLSFVSTNSICQGEQVALLWPSILEMGLDIEYAYTSFKWNNNAKHNAGVTCIIVALSPSDAVKTKRIYSDNLISVVKNINPYLAEGDNVIIPRRAKPISAFPEMKYGNKPTDGGFLILTPDERDNLVNNHPQSNKFIKRYMGADELLKGIRRYCIWVEDQDYQEAIQNPEIRKRFANVAAFRNGSKAKSTSDYADYPNRFKQRTYIQKQSIIIPSVTSERRRFITVEFVGTDVVTSNRAFSIFDPSPFIFGVLSSSMHNIWVNAVAGRLESRINYSSTICYNNFPFPEVDTTAKKQIEEKALNIIDVREEYPDRTLAKLYDPETMPEDLKLAHEELDSVVERIYRGRPFESDEERLSFLFGLYESMTQKGSL